MIAKRRLLRPPKGTRCDFHVGASLDSLGAPVLIRCPNEATVSALASEAASEVWVCEDHYAAHAGRFVRRTKPAQLGAS